MDEITKLGKTAFGYLNSLKFTVGESKVTVYNILLALVIFFVVIKISKLTQLFVRRLIKDQPFDSGVKASIEKISRYIVIVLGCLVVLQTMGINLNSLIAFATVFGVGVSFGFQNVASNFISGMIILFERPIKVGDLVTVGGVSGRVMKIGIRSTLIHTRDDVAIIVPNTQFISEQVINDSFSGANIRLHLNVGVAYGSDVKKVESILFEIADKHQDVLKNPGPEVFFTDFGDSSLDFKLLIWVIDNWRQQKILSDIRFEIDQRFREENVVIPFPQRDLHLKSSEINLR